MKSPFLAHDIGMKGVVCIVFTLPGSELVPYNDIVAALRPKEQGCDDVGNEIEDGSAEKEKDEKEKSLDGTSNKTASWDPIETVRIILKEVGSSGSDTNTENAGQAKVVSTSPPGSRFISRMIPIQATVSVRLGYNIHCINFDRFCQNLISSE